LNWATVHTARDLYDRFCVLRRFDIQQSLSFVRFSTGFEQFVDEDLIETEKRSVRIEFVDDIVAVAIGLIGDGAE
jgi:hypothetical protein